MSTARQPEPFHPPHAPAACPVCRYLALHPNHDPATCPGCLRRSSELPDYDADPKQDTGGAPAWLVAAVVVVFAVALYLFFSNDLAVLAR